MLNYSCTCAVCRAIYSSGGIFCILDIGVVVSVPFSMEIWWVVVVWVCDVVVEVDVVAVWFGEVCGLSGEVVAVVVVVVNFGVSVVVVLWGVVAVASKVVGVGDVVLVGWVGCVLLLVLPALQGIALIYPL
jgi:hypothetical protein